MANRELNLRIDRLLGFRLATVSESAVSVAKVDKGANGMTYLARTAVSGRLGAKVGKGRGDL